MTYWRRLLLLIALWMLQAPAWAHKPSDSYLTLRATTGSSEIAVRWDIALRDLDYVLQLDRDGNGDDDSLDDNDDDNGNDDDNDDSDDNGNDDGHHPADGDDDGDDIDEWQTQRRQSTHLPNTPTSTGKIKQKTNQ